MKKKLPVLMSIVFVILLVLSSTTAQPLSKQQRRSEYIETTNTVRISSFDSMTINDLIVIMKDYIDKLALSSTMKQRFYNFIDNGVGEMESFGIIPQHTVKESQIYQPTGFKGFLQRNHLFLMNFYPDVVSINVMLPTYLMNLTSDNESTNASQVLEIFVKLIPIFDNVQTQNRILLRKLYQKTSTLMPAIGGRIIQNETTIFILAFGPKIDWSMRFF